MRSGRSVFGFPRWTSGDWRSSEDEAAYGLSPVDTTGAASLVEGRSADEKVGEVVFVEDVADTEPA